jgi:hypothetical protein
MPESYFNIQHFIPPPPRHNIATHATKIPSVATHISASVLGQNHAPSGPHMEASRPATVEDATEKDGESDED